MIHLYQTFIPVIIDNDIYFLYSVVKSFVVSRPNAPFRLTSDFPARQLFVRVYKYPSTVEIPFYHSSGVKSAIAPFS